MRLEKAFICTLGKRHADDRPFTLKHGEPVIHVWQWRIEQVSARMTFKTKRGSDISKAKMSSDKILFDINSIWFHRIAGSETISVIG